LKCGPGDGLFLERENEPERLEEHDDEEEDEEHPLAEALITELFTRLVVFDPE
jgi:hypothetical protein